MYKIIKRIADIFVSILAMLILSPLLIPVMIGLKLTGEHYIFYMQERIGFKNKPFLIYKFATMLKNSPNMAGGIITTSKDPRILPFGGFLRKTKINELPQLLNIFFGHMSIVGPRPVMQKSFDQYSKAVQQVIYNVKPGLTGIGSIVFRDEEEIITKIKNEGGDTWEFYANIIYPHKGELEKWYQKNQSFFTDLKIIFTTAWVIVFPESKIVEKLFSDLPQRNF